MFQDVKRQATRHKILATILFGAIILVFALFSYNPPDRGMSTGYAARVNNRIISIREYRTAYDQMVAFYTQMFGGNFDPEAQKQMKVNHYALEQLIGREAAVQAADKAGIQATNDEVRDIVVGIPAFQENGQFRRDLYNNFLTNRQTSAAQFEADIKREIVFNKTRELFQKAMTPAAIEIDKMQKVGESQINLEYLKIDTSHPAKPISVSEAEAKAYLATPEGLKKSQEYFELNKGQFDREEEVHARHILIKVDKSKPESDKAAFEKITKIREDLKTKPFDVIAKKESEDIGSKVKGGDLGFFSRGRMVPEFENAAFSLEIGKVSEPIKTDYGYHLIKVEAKHPKALADFEKEKIGIAENILRVSKADQIVAKAKEALTAGKVQEIATITAPLGTKWEETGNFSLTDENVPKLGDDEAFFQAASQLTPAAPLFKQPISSNGATYIVRLKSKGKAVAKEDPKKAKLKPEDSKSRLASTRTRDAFSKWADGAVKSSKVERNEQLLNSEM